MRVYTCLLAYVLLTAALFRSPGLREPVSLALVLAALAAALAGTCSSRDRHQESSILTPAALGLLVAGELVWLGLTPPSVYRVYPEQDPSLRLFRLGVLLLSLLVLSYAWQAMPARRWRFPAILVVYFWLGGWVIKEASFKPGIDVWHLQQQACAAFLNGKNPYAAEYVNPYNDERYFAERVLKEGRIQSFPYPPLSLMLAVPGYGLGDVRWSLLLAMCATAGFIVAAGRRLGLPAGDPAELAAVSLLCQPRGLLVMEAAWTEPFLALAISAGFWAVLAGRRWTCAAALAAALAVKQFGFLLAPSLWSSQRVSWRQTAAAATLALATALPFLMWDAAGFWRGIVAFHAYSPFREDSLSFSAALAVATGYHLPAVAGLVAAAAVAWLVMRYLSPALSRAALGSAAVFLAFFAFSKAAHLNYYWLVAALLALALLLATAESRVPHDSIKSRQGDQGTRDSDRSPSASDRSIFD